MNIKKYFEINDIENSRDLGLINGPIFCKSVKDLFDNLIKSEIIKYSTKILEWHKMLVDYANLQDTPIYLIRKYESVGVKLNNKQDNRRGCLTLVVNNNKVEFAYAFVSNYDAQEIYNMIRNNVDAPKPEEFKKLLMNGSYQMHYDPKGGSCQDDKVSYFEHRGSIRAGVINSQNFYLAHIVGVNDYEYFNKYNLSKKEIDTIFFSRGSVTDWVDVDNINCFYSNFILETNPIKNGLRRKIRILNYCDIYNEFQNKVQSNVTEQEFKELYKQLLVAHFLRFVDPMNYFLVPGKDNEVNCIYGKKKISIGEYYPLVSYVNSFIKNHASLSKAKNEFDQLSMYNSNRSVWQPKGDEVINISYGLILTDYLFLEDKQIVKVPSKYTNIENFIDTFNKLNKRKPKLKIIYSLNNSEYTIESYCPKNLTEKKLKDCIKNNMNKNKLNFKIQDLDNIRIEESPVNKAIKNSTDNVIKQKRTPKIKTSNFKISSTNQGVLDDFKKFLLNKGLKDSSVRNYVSVIKKLLKTDNIGIDTFIKNIDTYSARFEHDEINHNLNKSALIKFKNMIE